MKDILEGILGEAAAGAVELLVIGVLLLIVIVLSLPLYFLMKKMSGSKTTFREDVKEAIEWRFDARAAAANPVVQQIDKVSGVVENLYRYILYGVLGAVTAGYVWFLVRFRGDSSYEFLAFYFSIGYVLFLLWTGSQFWQLRRRKESREPEAYSYKVNRTQPAGEAPAAAPMWFGLTLVQWLIVVMVFSAVTVAMVVFLTYQRMTG